MVIARINNNLNAQAESPAECHCGKHDQGFERLASGTIINRAADHAAGLRIATRLQSQFSD